MKSLFVLAGVLLLSFFPMGNGNAAELVLDDFEYDDPVEIFDRYSNSGWQGTGEAYISDTSIDGSHSMELYLTYDGGAWGGAAVISAQQEPFSFGSDQVVTLNIKGDPAKFKGDEAILVFQFRDAAGEVIRFLDYAGPKASDWITIKMPYSAFQEGPYDANPTVPADRNNLVTWEFYVQGVGADPVDPYEATLYLDNLKIADAVAPSAGDRDLDLFEYTNDSAIASNYVSAGWNGLGTPTLSTDHVEGTKAMKLSMTFDGPAWGSAGVRSLDQDPFSFTSNQVIRYSVKGDPTHLTSSDALIVLQFRDADGEICRYLDAVGPKAAEWTTIEIPYADFEESPWDSNPDKAADRTKLVGWEFSIQGVGADAVDSFQATILIDKFTLTTFVPPVNKDYAVHLIPSAQAPNVTDKVFDAIYASAAEEISYWEDDNYSPVAAPYNKTRAYLLTDKAKVYCGMLISDPDTSTLKTDTKNDTLLKWQTDSWEIVFAPHAGVEDGANYIKFAGDSIGFWDDISPDAAGGTDWSAPSFQTHAYILDANTWAAEFSVDIADIQSMFTGYDSYGHIGIQVKEPDLNFAWPDRAAFGSRNAHWDFSVLNPEVSVLNWSIF